MNEQFQPDRIESKSSNPEEQGRQFLHRKEVELAPITDAFEADDLTLDVLIRNIRNIVGEE